MCKILHVGFALLVLSSVCLNICRSKRKENQKRKFRSLSSSTSNWGSTYLKPSSKMSSSGIQNHTQNAIESPLENEGSNTFPFLISGDGVNVEYFSDIVSFLKNILYNYPNDSKETYFPNKKSENSYTFSFGHDMTFQNPENSFDVEEEIEDVFQRLQKSLEKKFTYWVEFIFDGFCVNSGKKDFQNVSEAILFKIVSKLMIFVERSKVGVNNYSCEEAMKINASLDRTTYEQHEQHLYNSIDIFTFELYQRRFVFVEFTSSKFTILQRKLPQPRRLGVFPFLAYGYSLLAITFLFLSTILYSCHNYVVRKRRRVYLVSNPIVDAYEEGNKPVAKELTFPNIYKTYPEQPTAKTAEEGSLLTLDFDTNSEIQEEPYKIREKSHSVQGLQNFQENSKRESRRGSSTLSECFVTFGEVGFSEYFRGLHYYYGNLEYDLNNSNEADLDTTTNEERSEQATPLPASCESLGGTRVEYVDGEESSFKFETDL